ncbi:nuclear transport factor 2 family protein [Chamaesiphon polymorphus]|uniref:SnoaL-like domain-containing protein n=1 Tax=Chamaesiphon polymorphus CCALA 037 TaxID=2107692 RepID=A0A2T1GCT9_9CYAN|nr:nuclear transport factor 2 family protein [Chamaesiphon polymorphus]PSB55181.1 hypothetical protein C7B77_15825 [Chamaesiphon polymorphus CCALA 037]
MRVEELEFAKQVFCAYNGCFMRRDLEALRKLYTDDGSFVYFDNHADCDSHNLDDHLSKVGEFFKAGEIVELETEVLGCSVQRESATIAAHVRYKRENPEPGVRASVFLERHGEEWKIRHIHYSTNPNKVDT